MMAKTNNVLCSSCGKRVATYYRLTSGEKLCRLCLFNSVAKQVRRTSHYYKMFRKNEKVIFAIRGDDIALSLESFFVLNNAMKDFDLEYKILCPNNLIDCRIVEEEARKHVKNGLEIYEVNYPVDIISKSIVYMVKYIDAYAAKIALENHVEYVVSLLFRDEISMILMLGLLLISKTVFGEGMPIKYVENVKIVRPFYNVLSHDILYLAYSSQEILKMDNSTNSVKVNVDGYIKKAYSILTRSPELMYSSSKSIEMLQSFIISKPSRCHLCGSFSDENVCEYCKVFAHIIRG
ncbi:MAG: hypothetical protein QW348_01080 [Ignisphaera sp.]